MGTSYLPLLAFRIMARGIFQSLSMRFASGTSLVLIEAADRVAERKRDGWYQIHDFFAWNEQRIVS